MRWWLIYIVKLNYHRCLFQDYIRGVNPQSCAQYVDRYNRGSYNLLRSFKENPPFSISLLPFHLVKKKDFQIEV